MGAVVIPRPAPALLKHMLLACKVNFTCTMLCTSGTTSLHVPTCLIFSFSNPSQPFPAHDLSASQCRTSGPTSNQEADLKMEYTCDDPGSEATRGRDDTCDHTAGCVPPTESDPVFVDPNSQGCFIMFLISYTFQHHPPSP